MLNDEKNSYRHKEYLLKLHVCEKFPFAERDATYLIHRDELPRTFAIAVDGERMNHVAAFRLSTHAVPKKKGRTRRMEDYTLGWVIFLDPEINKIYILHGHVTKEMLIW